jgi:hypothetical protein
MHGFHREKKSGIFKSSTDGWGYTLAHGDERYTRLAEGSVYNIEDEEWKYENNLPNRLDPIEEHFGDDDDSEKENSGDVDSEDRVSENERY